MKSLAKILLGSFLLSGVQFALSGCVADGYARESVYYGPERDPWFRDDPWMDGGGRWYRDGPSSVGVGVYISPPRYRH